MIDQARRYLPCALLLAAAVAWGKHSITPTIEKLSRTQHQITEYEKVMTEWEWIEKESVPGAAEPDEIRGMTVGEIAARITTSRVVLARLAESADGTAQFEIRSDFTGLMQFLDRIGGSSCHLVGVRKNGESGLRASFRMEAI